MGPVDGDQNVSKVDQSLFEQIGSEIVTTYEEIRYTPEMENSRISVESGYGNKKKRKENNTDEKDVSMESTYTPDVKAKAKEKERISIEKSVELVMPNEHLNSQRNGYQARNTYSSAKKKIGKEVEAAKLQNEQAPLYCIPIQIRPKDTKDRYLSRNGCGNGDTHQQLHQFLADGQLENKLDTEFKKPETTTEQQK